LLIAQQGAETSLHFGADDVSPLLVGPGHVLGALAKQFGHPIALLVAQLQPLGDGRLGQRGKPRPLHADLLQLPPLLVTEQLQPLPFRFLPERRQLLVALRRGKVLELDRQIEGVDALPGLDQLLQGSPLVWGEAQPLGDFVLDGKGQDTHELRLGTDRGARHQPAGGHRTNGQHDHPVTCTDKTDRASQGIYS